MSYYATAADVRTALDVLDLDPERFIITSGTVEGPVIPDGVGQVYTIGSRVVVGPNSLRCRAYRVTTIYTEADVDLVYDVPVHPTAALTEAQAQAVE